MSALLICPMGGALTWAPGTDPACVCEVCERVFRRSRAKLETEAQMQIPFDEVQCELSAERDIVTDSVRVVVQATLTLAGKDSTRVKATLGEVLSGVLDGNWQFSSIEREEDKSGMEQAVAVASARVKEHATGGLVERLTKASR